MNVSAAAALLLVGLGACATGHGERGTVRDVADTTPALALYAGGDFEASVAALAPLLAQEPWHVPAHRLHQDALRAAGRGEEARTLYLSAAAAAPDDPLRALLGARVTPREEGARLTAYRGALALDAESAWARAALASELLATSRDLAAAATARRDAGYPDEADVLDARRDAYRSEAARIADAAVERDRALAAAHEARATALTARAEAGEGNRAALLGLAVEAQEVAARLAPADTRPLARLAVLRHRAGDDGGAADAYRSALELDPGDPALLAGLGRALLDHGEAEDAAAALTEAVSARPDDPLLLLDLGVAQQRSGDLEAALESLRRATALAPGDARALRALALVAEERARRDAPDADPRR